MLDHFDQAWACENLPRQASKAIALLYGSERISTHQHCSSKQKTPAEARGLQGASKYVSCRKRATDLNQRGYRLHAYQF